jgi:AcrR family transcriptional regulator
MGSSSPPGLAGYASPVPTDGVGKPAHGHGREAILEATMRVVGRCGLTGLTNRAVAHEAGVTHGLIPYYFGSRDELIREAFRYAVGRSVRRFALASGGSVEEFAAGLDAVVATEADEEAFQYEMLLAALRRPEMLADVRATYADYVLAVRDELRRDGIVEPTDALARLVFAALDGLVLQQLLYGDPRSTETAVIRLRHILRGIRDQSGARKHRLERRVVDADASPAGDDPSP